MIKLSDFVIKYLVELGTKDIFLLPGGGCMHVLDSLGQNKKIKYTAFLHEQAAAIAADAYAQYTGKIGVVLVTTGPGGTNTVTGVAASWIDSTPVLYLSGQAQRKHMKTGLGVRQMGVQEVDIVSMVKPITKYAVTVMDPLTIKYHLDKAVVMARSGRQGPVWLEIPLDVQGAMIEGWTLSGLNGWQEKKKEDRRRKAEDRRLKKQVKKIMELLKNAEKPVLLAGNGIRAAGAVKEFVRLVEKLQIPVLLTWRAADMLDEKHPLYFGRPGIVGQRAANFIQQNADLLITVGARMDLPQTAFDHANFAPRAKKVIVDIDGSEIKKLEFKVDVAVVVDARKFIREITNVKIKNTKQKGQKESMQIQKQKWIKWCDVLKGKYPVPDISSLKTSEKYVNTYRFIDSLSGLLTGKEVLVPGSSGSCAEVTMQAVKVKKGLRILNTPGLGSMGFGLPASIGACIASGKKTVTIIGDGGLQHNIQELETIRRLQIPIKVFILSNNGYGSVRMMQLRHFNGRFVSCDPASGLTIPSTKKMAKAYGIRYSKIDYTQNLKLEIRKVLKSKSPMVCEVFIDPMQETIPRVSSAVMLDGKIISKPMEDLYPFLVRKEFESNMFLNCRPRG